MSDRVVVRLKGGAYQQLEVMGAPINVGPINNYSSATPNESCLWVEARFLSTAKLSRLFLLEERRQ